MRTADRAPRTDVQRARALAEIEALAWLLDNSIPVPGTGRRFGLDAVVGVLPGIGDVASGAIGLFVIWRASRMGLPRIVVGRMLLTTLIDVVVGAVPILGDAFDLWFKASTRNLALLRRHLERPDSATRDDWLAVLGLLGAVTVIVIAVGWLVASAISAALGALG